MPNVLYSGHQQNIGDLPAVLGGQILGTVGQSLRLEALSVMLTGAEGFDINVMLRGHQENNGWLDPVYNGALCGTPGKSLRLEAIQLQLTGSDADAYSIQYQTHCQDLGWTNWCKDGELCGTEGGGKRVEAVRILLTDKGVDLNVNSIQGYVKYEPSTAKPPVTNGKDLAGLVICINAGHGGSDPGAVGPLEEADMNLLVALRVGELLAARGASIIYTRTTDIHMYLSDRATIANNAGADMFVSVHHNGNNNPNVSGTCAICYPGSTEGIRLGNLVLAHLYSALGLRQIGLIQRDDSDVTYTKMVAVITEALFASCPSDCALFNNGGAEKEAQAIVSAIVEYFLG